MRETTLSALHLGGPVPPQTDWAVPGSPLLEASPGISPEMDPLPPAWSCGHEPSWGRGAVLRPRGDEETIQLKTGCIFSQQKLFCAPLS